MINRRRSSVCKRNQQGQWEEQDLIFDPVLVQQKEETKTRDTERERERGDVDIWELRKTLDRLFGAQFLRRKES